MRSLRVLLFAAIGATSPSAHAQLYNIAPIEGLNDFSADSVSPSGEVIGYAYVGGVRHGIIWSTSQTTILSNGTAERTYAGNANSSGQIVGQLVNSSVGHACRWNSSASSPEDLGSLAGASYSSGTADINMLGHILGSSDAFDGTTLARRPFLYRDGTMINLGAPSLPWAADDVRASALNDSDQVVGSVVRPEGMDIRAFIWDEALGMRLLANSWLNATDINNSGAIVGTHKELFGGPPDVYGSFYYAGGTFHNLGDLSLVGKVNNSGDVVGRSGDHRGVLWRNLVPMQLDTMLAQSGWTIESALDINDAGHILVSAYRNETPFQYRYSLLTPVPEPKSIVTLAVGLLGFVLLTHRARCKIAHLYE